MFGHVRGAFTGATHTTPGIFLEANNGTVFLDEVAQLRPSSQVSLLRVLEARIVRAVGGQHDRPVDFRVIAATNEPLQRLVQSGVFRGDLLHRLSGATIHVPPLRDRSEDIPLLIEHFIRALPMRYRHVMVSRDAISRLAEHAWSGNIRELKSVVEYLAYMSDAGLIRGEDVLSALHERCLLRDRAEHSPSRRTELLVMLERYGNDVNAVAAHYRRARATIYRWLQTYGIDTPVRVRHRKAAIADPVARHEQPSAE